MITWGETGGAVLRTSAATAPHEPGVYLFLDQQDEILYVGKATDLRQRLGQHALADKRPERWLDQKYHLVRRVVTEQAHDERSASWREEELIFALRPPYNGRRRGDPVGEPDRAPYIAVAQDEPGKLCFTLDPIVSSTGRAYGCFPQLGKGKGSPLGIACSDGYTALLRLMWAASSLGGHTPAALSRSAPVSYSVEVEPRMRDRLHRFLSGTGSRLAQELLDRAAGRPAYMQPGLLRDKDAALGFFAAGPQRIRALRLRHGVPAGPIGVAQVKQLITAEIRPLIEHD